MLVTFPCLPRIKPSPPQLEALFTALLRDVHLPEDIDAPLVSISSLPTRIQTKSDTSALPNASKTSSAGVDA